MSKSEGWRFCRCLLKWERVGTISPSTFSWPHFIPSHTSVLSRWGTGLHNRMLTSNSLALVGETKHTGGGSMWDSSMGVQEKRGSSERNGVSRRDWHERKMTTGIGAESVQKIPQNQGSWEEMRSKVITDSVSEDERSYEDGCPLLRPRMRERGPLRT